MSTHLELVSPPTATTKGQPGDTSPPERCYTALPFECAEGYAEQLLGSHVVASNRLTRVVLAELLSSEIPLDMRALAEKIASQTGERMDNGLVKRVRTAIKRILKERPGIIEKEGGKNLRVSPCELQARRLGEEGLDSASHNAKGRARDRINGHWSRQKENLLLGLKNEYNLNHEELYILGMLIVNIPRGIRQSEFRANLLQELLTRLPLGYIAKSGDTFHSGNRIMEELGGGRPINTYEDTVRIALPENPFGFLTRDTNKIGRANESPKKAISLENLKKIAELVFAALQCAQAQWMERAKEIIIRFDSANTDIPEEDTIANDPVLEDIINRTLGSGNLGWTPPDHSRNETALLTLRLGGLIEQRKMVFITGQKLIEHIGEYPTLDSFQIPGHLFDTGFLKEAGISKNDLDIDDLRTEIEKLYKEAEQEEKKPKKPLKRRKDTRAAQILEALDPKAVYYINPEAESELARAGTPVRFIPPHNGKANYDTETVELFNLHTFEIVIITWKDEMGRDHFGNIDWKQLVTRETAEKIRRRMGTTAKTARKASEASAARRADEFAAILDKGNLEK